jgi:hypothetical protein
MTNIVNNFTGLFSVYVDCRTRNLTESIKSFVITSNANDMTFNFTVSFIFPYLYGLLNKKKDYLNIDI